MQVRYVPGSVLHVSYMGHVPYHTVEILRGHGVKADYLAVGDSGVWSASDFHLRHSWFPPLTVFREFRMVWMVVARYEIVHAHFMVTVTRSGWELPLLHRMGRKLVAHYRGCEARDRETNIALHPQMNICEECDYDPPPCKAPHNVVRRRLAADYADAVLVTTPDLREFVPDATHMPFFAPVSAADSPGSGAAQRQFRIVHATNHPGIEGTRHIRDAVDTLRAKGFRVSLQVLTGARHEDVLRAFANADLAIGKMKMGYYANAQIESMAAGVPTVTYVRPEFMTDELRDSAFIFATIDSLPSVLEYYLTNPAALAEKRARARQSILRLHDNAVISQKYVALYRRLTRG